MLKTTSVDFTPADPIADENRNVNGVGDSKVDGAKVDAKIAKSKS